MTWIEIVRLVLLGGFLIFLIYGTLWSWERLVSLDFHVQRELARNETWQTRKEAEIKRLEERLQSTKSIQDSIQRLEFAVLRLIKAHDQAPDEVTDAAVKDILGVPPWQP